MSPSNHQHQHQHLQAATAHYAARSSVNINTQQMHTQTIGAKQMSKQQNRTDNETVLDVKGLMCPLPVLKTKVALNRLSPGDKLRVYATDPHSVVDFKAYCARSGHKLLEHYTEDDTYVFFISKK